VYIHAICSGRDGQRLAGVGGAMDFVRRLVFMRLMKCVGDYKNQPTAYVQGIEGNAYHIPRTERTSMIDQGAELSVRRQWEQRLYEQEHQRLDAIRVRCSIAYTAADRWPMLYLQLVKCTSVRGKFDLLEVLHASECAGFVLDGQLVESGDPGGRADAQGRERHLACVMPVTVKPPPPVIEPFSCKMPMAI
jgi:hypothetical protein